MYSRAFLLVELMVALVIFMLVSSVTLRLMGDIVAGQASGGRRLVLLQRLINQVDSGQVQVSRGSDKTIVFAGIVLPARQVCVGDKTMRMEVTYVGS